jgi:two-component system cell cycle sensor histidine kinase PleC
MQVFGQGSLAQQTAEGGTGLGLPIVQNLVRLHGGTFRLRSVLRKGTEAIVWLPPTRLLSARTAPVARRLGEDEAPPGSQGAQNCPEAEAWWRPRPGRAAQQATSGC